MFNKMKLGTKIALAFAFTAVLTLVNGGMNIMSLTKINEDAMDATEHYTVPLGSIATAEAGVMTTAVYMRDAILDKAGRDRQRLSNLIKERQAETRKELDHFVHEVNQEEMRKAGVRLKENTDAYFQRVDKVVEYAFAGETERAITALQDQTMSDIRKEVISSIARLREETLSSATKIAEANEAQTTSTIRTSIVILLVIMVAVVLLSVIFVRSIKSIIDSLISEAKRLKDAAMLGQLTVRGDLEKINFEFRDVIAGMNQTLDAVTGPLNVAASYVDQISKGDIPEKITDKYNGDFNEIKNNLNKCIDAVSLLVTDANMLADAAIDGRLSTRADASKHNGDFAKIVDGVNRTLDAVVGPVQEASRALEKLSQRDLQARVDGDYSGDHALIKNNLNTAAENLQKALIQVAEAVRQVTSASTQISGGSQSLAQGANEQASSLEEISSSLEELASMVRQNTSNAEQATHLAQEARTAAEKGNDAMTRMSDAIRRIKTSADETAKIIKTIDEIAFQTNLLALNAAVEAARAGDAGKGFAVVAEEVRNLAQRSADAAKSTAALIDESQKNADNGVAVSTQVGEILAQIVGGAQKVAELIAEVSTAAHEQSKGINQINIGVTEMNKVTQQNASLSEESASSAEELNSQADELMRMVGEFNLGVNFNMDPVQAAPRRSAQTNVAAGNRKRSVGSDAKLKSVQGGHVTKVASGAEEVLPLTDDELKNF